MPGRGADASCFADPDPDHGSGPRLGLELAALERNAEAGRRAFAAITAQRMPSDSWALLGATIDVALHTVGLGVPAAEVRTGLLGVFAEPHPLAAEVVEATAGLLSLAEGDPAAAAEQLGRYLASVGRHVTATLAGAPDGSDLDGYLIPRPTEGSLHLAHAQALLALGRHDEASAAVRRALDALERWPGWRRGPRRRAAGPHRRQHGPQGRVS